MNSPFPETAARDRLGKGQKIEIKPLTEIAAKLKRRRELAIARAPKAREVPTGPTFDEILAATDEAKPPPTTPKPTIKETAISTLDNPNNQNQTTPVGTTTVDQGDMNLDDDLDLEILSDDDEAEDGFGGFPGAILPGAGKARPAQPTPKRSPLMFDPFSQNRETLDEFEDEPLIDDGLNSDDESDSESERSWEVRKEEEGGEKDQDNEVVSGGGSGNKNDLEDSSSSDEEKQEEEENPVDNEEDVVMGDAIGTDLGAKEGVEKQPSNESDAGGDPKAGAPSAFAVLLAASDKVPEKTKRLQRKYLDTEAELSDEEGAGAAVSDDEDEDGVDDNGELADLITDEKVKAKDIQAAEDAHLQWARKKETEDLQKIIRGVNNGFRRPRFGGLDDADDELHGRLRRARDGDDDFGLDISGAFAFPSGFGLGGGGGGADDDEECEDEEMLNKARQQRILAGSQAAESQGGGPAIPLDEDSQAVLGLLARSASESQQGLGSGPMCPPPSRFSRDLGHSLKRSGPSFVGRQSTVVRNQSAGGLGLGGGRSFVFGRSENSNSAIAPDGGLPGGKSTAPTDEAPAGPVSFANLKQMAGIPGSAVGQNSEGGNSSKRKCNGGSTLVQRLKNKSCGMQHGSQESKNAAESVSEMCRNTSFGPPKKVQRR